jgi:hypothetical protein
VYGDVDEPLPLRLGQSAAAHDATRVAYAIDRTLVVTVAEGRLLLAVTLTWTIVSPSRGGDLPLTLEM